MAAVTLPTSPDSVPAAPADDLVATSPSPSDRPILVVREAPPPGRPHAYDVVLQWIAENFPGYASLFRIEHLPIAPTGDTSESVLVPWLRDPVEAWSMERYEEAMALIRACDSRGVPVVNRVDRLLNATKARGAELMASSGVRVPKTARIESVEAFRDTLCDIPLPLIVREDWGHQHPMLRVDTLEAARALPIEDMERPIAVELIDTRDHRDGYYRKYRYMAIGDAGVTSHLQISREWITRGEARVGDLNARHEELDYIGRPDPNHDRLQAARRALGLDFVAFDYAYDHEGRVVVWEGNPYPWLHFSSKSLVYRNASMHRTMAALLKLYLDRAGVPVTQRLADMLDYAKPPTTTWMGLAPMAIPRRQQASVRPMRCLGEVEVGRRPGDRIALDVPVRVKSVKAVARSAGPRAAEARLIPPGKAGKGKAANGAGGDGKSARRRYLALGLGDAVRMTVLVDEGEARAAARKVSLVRVRSDRQEEVVPAGRFRKSKLHFAPVLVIPAGERVDQLRILSRLPAATRFCLLGLPLDGSDWPDLPRSTVFDLALTYRRVEPGATLIANPFASGGHYAVILTPWGEPDRRAEDCAAITGFEAWRITDRVGDDAVVQPVVGGPRSAAGGEVADVDSTVDADQLASIDRARKGLTEALVTLARTTRHDAVRQAAFDRLVEDNRAPDSLVSRRGLTMRAAGSFRRAMLAWSRWSSDQGRVLGTPKALEWLVKDKEHGHRLAAALGADILARRGPMSAAEAVGAAGEAARPVVVKPVGGAGSQGVYVVHGPDRVLELATRAWIGGLDELGSRLAATRWPNWLVEDYLGAVGNPECPAPDLKFYSFYGRVGLVLEAERFPELRYAWWKPDGAPVITGIFDDKLFAGHGFTSAQKQRVEAISAAMPLPFMRIDFLRGADRFAFGEFTPRPGDFETYNAATDRMLGDCYLDAEARLYADLLAGKQFPVFMEWLAPFRAGAGIGTEGAARG
ncbi:MAG: hypothetical protein KDK07_04315 [Bauldia sp.]|nr:hypothetical protein [Bauldia sp.]